MRIIFLFLMTLGLLQPAFASNAKTVTVPIKGMVCSACTQKVELAFKSSGKVADVQVFLKKGLAVLTFREGQFLSPTEIEEVVTDAGFSVDRGRS